MESFSTARRSSQDVLDSEAVRGGEVKVARLTTKELSKKTWPDYVRFFSQGNGWDHCGCLANHGLGAPSKVKKWIDKRDWSLDLKERLLESGITHGILVYSEGETVGWCQFGPRSELPFPEQQRKELLNGEAGWKRNTGTWGETDTRKGPVWRITCFCTDKRFSQKGIAGVALHGALDAIRERGGGLVEAFPVATVPDSDERLASAKEWRRELFKLIKNHGRFSQEVERFMGSKPPPITVTVDGLGEVNGLIPLYGALFAGTVAMFQRAGFKAVAPMGHGPRVVMQRRVKAKAR